MGQVCSAQDDGFVEQPRSIQACENNSVIKEKELPVESPRDLHPGEESPYASSSDGDTVQQEARETPRSVSPSSVTNTHLASGDRHHGEVHAQGEVLEQGAGATGDAGDGALPKVNADKIMHEANTENTEDVDDRVLPTADADQILPEVNAENAEDGDTEVSTEDTGNKLSRRASVVERANALVAAKREAAKQPPVFTIGQRVECMDNDLPNWMVGIVTSVEPLLVRLEEDSTNDDEGDEWDCVRPVGRLA